MSRDDSFVKGLKDFTAGGLAGMVQIASSHPLDTIKTRLQAEGGQRYASALDVLTKTVRSEGVLALYKGMLYPLVGNAFVNSALFAIFGRISHFLHPDSTTPTPITVVAISGAGAGLLQSIIASPVEMVKIRMQTQYAGETRYRGPTDCIKQLWARHGFAGVYNGLGATAMREMPAYAAWYAMYTFMKRKLIPENATDISPLRLMASGASGGVAYWTACYPLDRAKTMIQSQDLAAPKYRNVFHCLGEIVGREGIIGLWKGFGPCLLRTLPASSSTFLAFEIVSKLLNK